MSLDIYDPIRCKFVRATPEEKIRQRVIHKMVDALGYPKGLIVVEKDITFLSFANPTRRIDILCYMQAKEGLKPLLLVECKAEKLDIHAERQLLGYNDAIGAPFCALASDAEVKTFWREQDQIASIPFLPRFDQLVEQVC